MKEKIKDKTKKKIIEDWIINHGAATFDLKKGDIILHDGGLFSIEKEIKIMPKTRILFSKLKDNKFRELKFIPIKRNGRVLKENVEYYKAYFWFEELDDIIRYFKSMKRMLNKLGYKTDRNIK